MRDKRIVEAVNKLLGEASSNLLWIRIGDQGDYENYGSESWLDLDVLAEDLIAAGVTTIEWRKSGFTSEPKYTGDNYVSCYIGDADSEWVRDLTDEEKERLEHEITEAQLVAAIPESKRPKRK
jgi:hypothetical protein